MHGRGGQGVVTLSRLIAMSLYHEGKTVQAFPTFGAERTGAPVAAFVRISDTPETIAIHHPITTPNLVIVQDATLLPLLSWNLKDQAQVLINSSASIENFTLPEHVRPQAILFDASSLATAILGTPIPNTAILAYCAKNILNISKEAVLAAINEHFGHKKSLLESNLKLVEAVWNS